MVGSFVELAIATDAATVEASLHAKFHCYCHCLRKVMGLGGLVRDFVAYVATVVAFAVVVFAVVAIAVVVVVTAVVAASTVAVDVEFDVAEPVDGATNFAHFEFVAATVAAAVAGFVAGAICADAAFVVSLLQFAAASAAAVGRFVSAVEWEQIVDLVESGRFVKVKLVFAKCAAVIVEAIVVAAVVLYKVCAVFERFAEFAGHCWVVVFLGVVDVPLGWVYVIRATECLTQ